MLVGQIRVIKVVFLRSVRHVLVLILQVGEQAS